MYYDGTKLINTKDLNKETPEIFICSGNRSAGKTVWFNRYAVNKFIKRGEKFCLLYRYGYELDDCANKFFSEIQKLFFSEWTMTSKKKARGLYAELFLEKGETVYPCGYAIAINASDNIKKYSHMLADSTMILFDEFMSESNKYCPNEIDKFISIHVSLARGGGKQSKYLPVYLIGNLVTLLNPYYTALNVSSRLQYNTKFLRGNGWVLECCLNTSASQAQQNSAFNKAFNNNQYIKYSRELIYLNDNNTFVDKINGVTRYLFTLNYNGKKYSVKQAQNNLMYASKSYDQSYPISYCVSADDMDKNSMIMDKNGLYCSSLRKMFCTGAFRFENLECKEAIMKLLSY